MIDISMPNPIEMLYDILNNAQELALKPNSEIMYYYWNSHQQLDKIESNTMLASLIENSENACLLLLTDKHDYQHRLKIVAFKDSFSGVELPQMAHINHIESIEKMRILFDENRTPRKFNLNPKHGENGKNTRTNKGEKVSPPHCSKEEAQILLNTAIGDFKTTTELYNYDESHSRFIVFKYENDSPANQYHGYHVDSINEIPAFIRTLLQP